MKTKVAQASSHNIISVKEEAGTIWTTAGNYTFGLSPLVVGLVAVIIWQRYKTNRRYY